MAPVVSDGDGVRLRGVGADVTRLGFDLDLTLIDTRDAVRVTLEVINNSFDDCVDIEVLVGRLGPPLRSELALYIPEEDLDEALAVYREAFLAEGVSHLKPLPGAQALFAHGRQSGAFLAVVTARFPSQANPCLDVCELRPDHLIGNVVGAEKAPGIRELELEVFVGDHPFDMEAAQVAGVPGIGVTTGHHNAEELSEAGAHIVVDSLVELIDH